MNDEYEPKASPAESTAASTAPRKKEKKRMSGAAIIALALCFSLLGGLVGSAGGGWIKDRLSAAPAAREEAAVSESSDPTASSDPDGALPDDPATEAPAESPTSEPTQAPTEAPTEEPSAEPSGTPGAKLGSADRSTPAPASAEKGNIGERGEMSAADVYEANVNSTVGITTSITTNYWGYQSSGAASGSGFIYSADGYVLTNYHVVEDSTAVTVTMFDGTAYKAEIVGYDADNDVAVLKIDAEGLKPVTLGSSDSLRVGDDVLAIGNPLGELTFSLTKGCVSALNHEVTLSSGTTMDLIQTDAAINSGNSGGALFNMYGEVVGITNAKYSSSNRSSAASVDNIGFAIPIDSVKRIISEIIEYGHAVKPYIGVSIYTVTAEMQDYGLPLGAVVNAVSEGSPAEAAGLRKNDIITAINGESVSNSSELKRIISRSTPGDELVLSVYRREEGDIKLTVVVTDRPEPTPTPEPQNQQQWSSRGDDPYGDIFGGFPFGGFPFGNAG